MTLVGIAIAVVIICLAGIVTMSVVLMRYFSIRDGLPTKTSPGDCINIATEQHCVYWYDGDMQVYLQPLNSAILYTLSHKRFKREYRRIKSE